jgi:hypothetical protein
MTESRPKITTGPDEDCRQQAVDPDDRLVLVDDPDADEHVEFVGRRPVGREIRRQIEAG